jgi:hypothetical protein
MTKCDCCNRGNENEIMKKYELPKIGYGSIFDTLTEEDRISFSLCHSCRAKMNKYIRRRGLTPYELWSCRINRTYDKNYNMLYEEFEYEDLLYKVLHRFVPKCVSCIEPIKTKSQRIKEFVFSRFKRRILSK